MRIGLICVLAMSLWTAPALAEETALQQNYRWTRAHSRTPAELGGFRPQPMKLSKYGGAASWPKTKATGFFRTEQSQGRWWLVDPEGHMFLTVGLCSVNLSMFKDSQANGAWARTTADLLRAEGFNTLGRWSDADKFRKLDPPMVYTTTLSFMAAYAKHRGPNNGKPGFPEKCLPVFDPEFETSCDHYAQKLAATKDDPWLLGHFTRPRIQVQTTPRPAAQQGAG